MQEAVIYKQTPRIMPRQTHDGRWKWVVMVAVYTGIVILSTSAYMAGILYVAILNKFDGDKAMTSLIVSLNAGLLSLLGPLASTVVDKFSCRSSIVTGAVLLTFSGLTSAFVNDLDWLLVTYGIIGGIGNSLVSVPYSISLGYYFDKQRSSLIALSTAVIGLGMFIASPVALYFLENLSLNETFLAIGALNCHLGIIGIICRPSVRERHIRNRTRLKISDNQSGNSNTNLKQYTLTLIATCTSSPLSNISLLLFLLSLMMSSVMFSICLLHLPNYASVLGASDIEITLLMTCFSVSNTSGRFLTALTVARSNLDILVIHILVLGVFGVVTVSYPFYSVLAASKYMFAVVSGLLTGVPESLMTPITLLMVGVEHLSAAHGLEYCFTGIGFLVGPPVAGFLYGKSGSYKYSFICAGCIPLFGSLLALAARVKRSRPDAYGTTKTIQGLEQDSATSNNGVSCKDKLINKSKQDDYTTNNGVTCKDKLINKSELDDSTTNNGVT